MKVGFHLNSLDARGVPVAVFDYAKYNRDLLGNDSHIFFPQSAEDTFSLDRFISEFGSDNITCYSSKADFNVSAMGHGIDVMYFIKYGHDDGMNLEGIKNVIHTVFKSKEPHGDVYAYVSKWLSIEMSAGELPYVPHIISLPDITSDYREFLNIPKDSIVFGRHGGNKEFNIQWVYPVIEKVAEENPNIYFLFMNTDVFCKTLPNIIHLDPTFDVEEKTAFINTCDCMIHARERGESFGLAIGEFLHQNKPVITNNAGEDLNHMYMLGYNGLYYANQNELYYLLINFKKHSGDNRYKNLVQEYSPQNVMNKFKEVFLQ